MAYIGNDLQVAYQSYQIIDDISGSFNGSTTSFALLVGGVAPVPFPINEQQCLISVGGVIQEPDPTGTNGFRFSGSNIVFSSAPGSGEDFFGVILAGADYVNVGVNYPSGSVSAPSITFDTDLDTGIYNPAANELGLVTNGSDAIRINSSGDVTIGSDLTVDTDTLYVDSANNRVGIGTTSPDTLLHAEAATGAVLRLGSSDTTLAATETVGLIEFETADSTNSGVASSIEAIAENASGEIGLAFSTGTAGSATEKVRIDRDGRFLVGTSTSSGFASARMIINSAGTDTTGAANLVLQVGETNGSISADEQIGNINFGDESGYIYAAIQALADIAAGSDSPGRLVFSTTVDGASSPTARFRIQNQGRQSMLSADYVLNLRSESAASGVIEALYIARSATTLDNGTGVFAVYTNGTYATLSDQTQKKNIETTRDGYLEDLNRLRVVKYNWNEQQDDEPKELGLIAQEVEQVFPGLITEMKSGEGEDETTNKGVKAGVLPYMLLKALQEATQRIETLEAEVAALKAQ